MEKKLTERQSRFVDNYVATGNGAEAARRAGYSEDNARNQAVENLAKPYIKEAVSEMLDRGEVTKPRLIEKINEGLEAMLTKIASHEGKITDTREFIDFVTRHKYIETALKLHDMFPAEKKKLSHDFSNITLEDEKAAIQRVNRLLDRRVEEEIRKREGH